MSADQVIAVVFFAAQAIGGGMYVGYRGWNWDDRPWPYDLMGVMWSVAAVVLAIRAF